MIESIILVLGFLGLVYAAFKAFEVLRADKGNARMQEISSYIREGAFAYLRKQYSVLAVFIILMAIIIALLINPLTGVTYVAGAISSILAGFIGMAIATQANSRTTQAASKGVTGALSIAFSSGTVMAMAAASIGVIGLTVLYIILQDITVVMGFALGASSVALFARVGGGIYTKAADVGADLVGKIEAGIPDDDPRNPAVIADNVGDNVGDVAGMGADLFESYVGSIVASIALGVLIFTGTNAILFPLAVSALGLVASIIGGYFVSADKEEKVQGALMRGLIVASILIIVGSFFAANALLPEKFAAAGIEYAAFPLFGLVVHPVFVAIVVGVLVGVLIGIATEYYTSHSYEPVRGLAHSSHSGPATVVIHGIALGFESTVIPVLLIVTGIFVSYQFAGIYGIAISAVGMLSTLGISLAIDAYGPVADNAGGIAEMTKQPAKVRKSTDALDSAGNTTAAIGKGFAVGSAALTALALFSAYSATAGLKTIDILDVNVTIGLFLGALLPFIFAALTMRAVGRTAFAMVLEVRRQFKEIKGLMQGKAKADYAKCVEISTSGAQREMILPGVIAILSPIAVGLSLGPGALGGLLAGALVTGVLLAISMANSGGAWDNAKKFIETGEHGGKGSNQHKATVVGDTIGDPFKDTSAPAMNILIKLMTIVSLVFLPLFVL